MTVADAGAASISKCATSAGSIACNEQIALICASARTEDFSEMIAH